MWPSLSRKPAASLEPMATPRTPGSPSESMPARAVTSPSLMTSKGTPHSSASAVEDAPDLGLEEVRRHGPEERGDPDLVADDDPGRRAADGVDAREVGGGLLQAVLDHAVVVVGIGLRRRGPGDLLAPDRPAVDDGRDLVVAGAEVEADAAAVEMAAREADRLAGFREGRGAVEDDLERPPVDAGHGPDVEGPGAAFGVLGLEAAADRGRALEVDAPAAARPEQELDRALDHPVGGFRIGVLAGEGRSKTETSPSSRSTASRRGRPSGRPGPLEVFSPGEDDRLEGRIARRRRNAPAVRHLALNSTFTGARRRAASSSTWRAQPLAPGEAGRGDAALPGRRPPSR